MSVTEDRIRTALHEEADALLVTEEGLGRLEAGLTAAVRSSVDEAHARRRRVREPVVAAAAVVALVVSCVALWRTEHEPPRLDVPAGPQATPSATVRFDPALVGLWRAGLDGNWLWQVTADGRIGWDGDADSYLSSGLADLVARNRDVYELAEASSACPTRMRIAFSGADTATATVLASDCLEEQAPALVVELDRVSGRQPGSAPHRPTYEAEQRHRPRTLDDLSGTWLEPTTETVLVIGSPGVDGDARYVVDDDGDGAVAPDQRGRMALTAAGGTTVEPDPETPRGCAPTFSRVTTDTATMTTTAARRSCFPAGSRQTWIAIN